MHEITSNLSYYQGVLEIRMPLPEHEVNKELIGDMVKMLLDELELDWEPFGSTTFKLPEMAVGSKPAACFYLQNARRMLGKRRLNLSVDPPPDLAIEIDVTSKTQLSAYMAFGVPELWCYADGKLQVFVLQEAYSTVGASSVTQILNQPLARQKINSRAFSKSPLKWTGMPSTVAV